MQAFGVETDGPITQHSQQHHMINLRIGYQGFLKKLTLFFYFLEFYFVCGIVWPVYACAPYMCLVSIEVRMGTRFPGTCVIGGCKMPCAC